MDAVVKSTYFLNKTITSNARISFTLKLNQEFSTCGPPTCTVLYISSETLDSHGGEECEDDCLMGLLRYLVEVDRRFRGVCCLDYHLPDNGDINVGTLLSVRIIDRLREDVISQAGSSISDFVTQTLSAIRTLKRNQSAVFSF